jgi:hypothetical protein
LARARCSSRASIRPDHSVRNDNGDEGGLSGHFAFDRLLRLALPRFDKSATGLNYGLVLTVYILYVVGFLTGITVLVGVLIAYLERDITDRVSQSHFQFQISTFWIGLLYFFVGLITHHFAVGVIICFGGSFGR